MYLGLGNKVYSMFWFLFKIKVGNLYKIFVDVVKMYFLEFILGGFGVSLDLFFDNF